MEQEALIAKIRSGELVQPTEVQAQIYDLLLEEFLPRPRVILVHSADAKELREIYLDVFGSPPSQPKTLWRSALEVCCRKDLGSLRKTYRVRIRWEDLQEFRAGLQLVFRLHGSRQHQAAQKKLRWVQTEGEKSLWQSVVNSGSSHSNQPVAASCKYCKKLYEPERANSASNCCTRISCRKQADAARKWEEYHSSHAVQRKKIVAVQRARMQKAAAQKARATKAG